MEKIIFCNPMPAVTITVEERVVHTMSEGLGFNWYSCYDPKTYPAADDEERWARIFGHVDFLNMSFVRFGQSVGKVSDAQGNFKPGHVSFDQLRRLNQYAEKRNISIILDPFYPPKAFCFEPWPGAPEVWNEKNNYATGIKDISGYVNRFVVPYLKFVREEMKCSRVTWFNHVNEPLQGGIYATPAGIDDHVRYVEVLAAIRQALDAAGLEHIGSMGPDTHSLKYWPLDRMLKMNADPDPSIQAYCMHHYFSRFDWDSPSTSMPRTDPLSITIGSQFTPMCEYAHSRGKPFFMTELGMFHYGWKWGDPSGIARHDNALLEAEFYVRAMNNKVDGVLRWAWLNPGTHDGWWQLIQTIDGSDAPVRDPYYSYATLMRYVDKNAAILSATVSDPSGAGKTLQAVAAINPDGSRTLIVVNDHYSNAMTVLLRFPLGGATLVRKFVNDHLRKHQECDAIRITSGDLEHADVLAPMSLNVYTTKGI